MSAPHKGNNHLTILPEYANCNWRGGFRHGFRCFDTQAKLDYLQLCNYFIKSCCCCVHFPCSSSVACVEHVKSWAKLTLCIFFRPDIVLGQVPPVRGAPRAWGQGVGGQIPGRVLPHWRLSSRDRPAGSWTCFNFGSVPETPTSAAAAAEGTLHAT